MDAASTAHKAPVADLGTHHPGLAAHIHILSEHRAAREPDLPTDGRAVADLNAMRHLDEVVDLGPVADSSGGCVVAVARMGGVRRIDGGVRADLDPVTEHHTGAVRDPHAGSVAVKGEAEAIAAHNGAVLDHDAIAGPPLAEAVAAEAAEVVADVLRDAPIAVEIIVIDRSGAIQARRGFAE